MKITEHEMRGLLAGKCVPADMLVNETLSSYLVRKFFESEDTLRIKSNHITLRDGYIAELEGDNEELKDELSALQQKLDAVLAENVALKVSRQAVVNAFDDAMNEFGIARGETAAGYPCPEAPLTDAILNAVRAEGVEVVRKHPAIGLCSLTHICDEIAAQLRAETDTTSSQYESLAGGK